MGVHTDRHGSQGKAFIDIDTCVITVLGTSECS